MHWYIDVLKKYTVFEGRARRMEYWMFILFNLIIAMVLSILDRVIFSTPMEGVGPLYIVYMLAVLLPSIAVLIRRLHDIGKSGWWFFIALIPIVGAIWLLVLLLTEGQKGDNEYGSNPKEVPQEV